MRVMCIDDRRAERYLKVFAIYTVVERRACPRCKGLGYLLAEVVLEPFTDPDGIYKCATCLQDLTFEEARLTSGAFSCRRFIPIDPDGLMIREVLVERAKDFEHSIKMAPPRRSALLPELPLKPVKK